MKQILIIEKDSSILKALVLVLSKKYNIDGAKDGSSGIDKATHKKYDIIITNLNLPDYDGLEIIRIIKEHIPDIISIIVTGRGSKKSSISAIHLGVAEYLEKPVSIKTMEKAIAYALKRTKNNQTMG